MKKWIRLAVLLTVGLGLAISGIPQASAEPATGVKCIDLNKYVLCREPGAMLYSLTEIDRVVDLVLGPKPGEQVKILFISDTYKQPTLPRRPAMGAYNINGQLILISNLTKMTANKKSATPFVYVVLAHELWHHKLGHQPAQHCTMLQSKEHLWQIKMIWPDAEFYKWSKYLGYLASACMAESGRL